MISKYLKYLDLYNNYMRINIFLIIFLNFFKLMKQFLYRNKFVKRNKYIFLIIFYLSLALFNDKNNLVL